MDSSTSSILDLRDDVLKLLSAAKSMTESLNKLSTLIVGQKVDTDSVELLNKIENDLRAGKCSNEAESGRRHSTSSILTTDLHQNGSWRPLHSKRVHFLETYSNVDNLESSLATGQISTASNVNRKTKHCPENTLSMTSNIQTTNNLPTNGDVHHRTMFFPELAFNPIELPNEGRRRSVQDMRSANSMFSNRICDGHTDLVNGGTPNLISARVTSPIRKNNSMDMSAAYSKITKQSIVLEQVPHQPQVPKRRRAF